MKLRNHRSSFWRLLVALCAGLSLASPIAAQDLENAQLVHPSSDSWPGYHGDYSGRRHVSFTQITPQNVSDLSLAWAFQTNQPAQIKSSPLLVDGILYFTVPDNIWAVDARSGHMIWHYNRPSKGEHIGHRGVAMLKGWLFFTTPDAHLISLNAKDGTVRWDKIIADTSKGYWSTMAPLVVKNHVIAGVGGDLDNLPGLLRSFDPETGATQWQWDVTPPAGTPNTATGGMTWMTGTYDPGSQSPLLGNRQSHSCAQRQTAPRRQSLHLQHRRVQSRHRQARLGLLRLPP